MRYNYRVYPSKGQHHALLRLFGACRFAYNWFISQRETMYQRGGKTPSYNQLSQAFSVLKQDPEYVWLNTHSSVPLQQSLRHAQKAYDMFFKQREQGNKWGKPQYKSKRSNQQSAEFTKTARFKLVHTQGCKWAFLTLPKIGRLKLRWTRDLPSTPSSVTIIKHANNYFEASFVVEQTLDVSVPNPKVQACGIDMGLTHLMSIVYTDGTRQKLPHPHTLKQYERKIRRLDQRLSRRKKGSHNREKTRVQRAKLYQRIVNQRKDLAFKTAHMVVDETQAIAIETLNVKGLAKTKIAKNLLDAQWSKIFSCMNYLAGRYGRKLVRVDRFYPSSQLCSQCKVRDGKKPLSVRVWQCKHCHTVLDRDYNAALNILDAAGLAESLNACGDKVRRNLVQTGSNAQVDEARTRRTYPLH